ncbi:MAG: DUF4058 family protein [Phycisphaerae bacterium]|nr:DUF4058 family protein [Tepidisphaeraceae bacterium]
MKSPFPGMDPYLERHWEDVHTRLIGYVADALQPQLSEDLIARMEEKVYVEDESEIRLRRPDVRIVENPTPWQPSAGDSATAVVDEPVLLEPVGDPIRERNVVIYDSAGHRIVTAIEILSPWKKSPGKAVQAYLDKREKYVNSEMNLVEIDLIRTGDWTSMIGPYLVPEKARTTYRVTVVQPEARGPLLYPISIRAKLPRIKVPLRPQDAPAVLDLQELIDKAYVMGRYHHIDYARPPTPPFAPVEHAWAEQVLKAVGKA